MAKKKISDTARLIAWAMSVTEVELNAMGETITAIRDSRFPVAAKSKPRAVRSDAGRSRQSRLNPPPALAENGAGDGQ